jgi:hypothetical protein
MTHLKKYLLVYTELKGPHFFRKVKVMCYNYNHIDIHCHFQYLSKFFRNTLLYYINEKILPVIMLISTALLLATIICNSVCTPAKLPCRRVVKG